MNLKKKLLLIIYICISFNTIYAQYTEIINSNKPGFSESPYSVGKGIYQFESNTFFRNTTIESTFSKPQALGTDLLFRTSFFLERLEFNTQLTYQQDKVAIKNFFTSHYFSTGFSRITIGAKYLVYEPKYEDKSKEVRSWKRRHAFDLKRLIPSVGIYLGMNTNIINEIHQAAGITAKTGILLQHNLSTNFNLITNIFYDNIGSDFNELSYIVTATNHFNRKWSVFLENQAVFKKFQDNINIGLGFAYLKNRNLQFNTSGRFLLEGNAKGFYASLGASYRIDLHKDPYTELDGDIMLLEESRVTKGDNFFKRIFSFLKKKEKTPLGRTRPKRSRKLIINKKKGGLFKIFGKKKPKKKKVETELEKLEREIKELEKEMEKEDKKNENN